MTNPSKLPHPPLPAKSDPQELRELLVSCWQRKPAERPEFDAIARTLRTLQAKYPAKKR